LSAFKKDKCELIVKKADIDDLKTGGKKTTKVKENYNIINNTENKELLGLRTGLKAYSEKPRVDGEERPERPERTERKFKEPREPRDGEN